MKDLRRYPRQFVALAIVLVPALAQATLGDSADSTDADQAQLHARKAVRPGNAYAIHELTLPSGTTVREFVSPAGRVFAVAWRGSTLPDLRQILGENNLQTFLSAPPAQHAQRRSRFVQQPGLVARSIGHGRAFSGFAYVPALMPEGVTEEELR